PRPGRGAGAHGRLPATEVVAPGARARRPRHVLLGMVRLRRPAPRGAGPVVARWQRLRAPRTARRRDRSIAAAGTGAVGRRRCRIGRRPTATRGGFGFRPHRAPLARRVRAAQALAGRGTVETPRLPAVPPRGVPAAV